VTPGPILTTVPEKLTAITQFHQLPCLLNSSIVFARGNLNHRDHKPPMMVGYVNGYGRTPSWILYSAGWIGMASVCMRSSLCPGSGVEAGRTSNFAPTAGSQAAIFCPSVMIEGLGQFV
jgi:hypothetical protein